MDPKHHESGDAVRIVPEDWLHPIPLNRWFPALQPLHVDLGSGKGRFLLAHARAHPEFNFLGIERMLRRVRDVERKIRHRRLGNVRLLRMEARYATTYLLPADTVRTCYLFFPDPWPKKRHHGHRLVNAAFVNALFRILEPGGEVHVATDHRLYYEEIRALLSGDPRFESVDPFVPEKDEQTDFERYYVRHTDIGRCSARKRTA